MAYLRKLTNASRTEIGVYLTSGRYIEVPAKGETIFNDKHKPKSKNPYIRSFVKKRKK